jgi:hypothetical protein
MAPLLDIMGYLMDNNEVAQQVMNGTFIPPEEIDEVAIELLETLKMEDSVCQLGPLDMSISLDDNQTGWRKQKERTASEPTGLGFNHYKTSCLTKDLNLASLIDPIQSIEWIKLQTKYGIELSTSIRIIRVNLLKIWAILKYINLLTRRDT